MLVILLAAFFLSYSEAATSFRNNKGKLCFTKADVVYIKKCLTVDGVRECKPRKYLAHREKNESTGKSTGRFCDLVSWSRNRQAEFRKIRSDNDLNKAIETFLDEDEADEVLNA